MINIKIKNLIKNENIIFYIKLLNMNIIIS